MYKAGESILGIGRAFGRGGSAVHRVLSAPRGASKEAAANGYECVLGAVVLVQIESAAAERMAGTHYGDIVRVKQRSRSG